VERLWAPWRMSYVSGAQGAPPGCVFCAALAADDDRRVLIVHRGPLAFLILNAFPYASGHLMAVLNRHGGGVQDASPAELADAMALVQLGIRALETAYRPDGFNVGLNQGRAAGAGVPDHVHVHVVPRWNGDTNFMPVVGDARVLPESLDVTCARIAAALAP
jgi:ATP adenylyltransferase